MYIYSNSCEISLNREVSDTKDSCLKSESGSSSSSREENGVSWSISSYGANSRK